MKNSKILIGVIVHILLISILLLNGCSQNNSQINNKPTTISKNNFIFMESIYLNGEVADPYHCTQVKKCSTNEGAQFDCPKTDMLTLKFRVTNVDSLSFITCSVNDGQNVYPQQHFSFDQNTKTSEMSFENIAYNKNHNFIIFCKDESQQTPEEFCLDSVQVKSIC